MHLVIGTGAYFLNIEIITKDLLTAYLMHLLLSICFLFIKIITKKMVKSSIKWILD